MYNFLPALSCPTFTYGAEINAGNPQNQPTPIPKEALALAARAEKTWRLKLLDPLKAFIGRIQTSVREWIDKLLNIPALQPQPSINEALNRATLMGIGLYPN